MKQNLVDCLIDTLNNERINYCHWKSNVDLSQATAGEMDLDFLIDRESHQPMLAVLARLGFKPAMVRYGANTPGITHFYGYDPATDRYAHVHLFSKVLTGESFMKSHLLPIENMLLENTRFDGQMRVPDKSAELVLFIIRTFIKYGSLLDIAYIYKKTEKIRSELRWLKSGSDLPTALRLLRQYVPVIDEGLFLQCIDTLENTSSLTARMRLARKVRARIHGYAKHTFLERMAGLSRLALNQAQRRIGPRKKNKVLQAGGAIIAVVGPDATGKSTIVSETGKWLGQNFMVRVIHAGKPPASVITVPVNSLLGIAKRVSPAASRAAQASQAGEGNTPRKAKGLSSLLYALRAVALAWDRRNLLLQSWRAAARGEIVVSDRYPSSITGAMDSPRLEELDGSGWKSSLYNRAARLEKSLYQQVPPPDIVLRLQVPVEIALERNRQRSKPGDEPDEYIQARHALSSAWQRPDTARVFDVDTAQTLEQTLLDVKQIVWHAL